MSEPSFSMACVATDRTRPIMSGRVAVAGCQLTITSDEPEPIFRRAFREQFFDITELSMASHIVTTARGDSPYVGIPVFLSRAFRHSGIYIRTDRGIAGPADLRGRTVGLPDYQQTAAMWVRGILNDQYGIGPADIAWRTGGMEQPAEERLKLTLPATLDVKPIGQTTLNAMLVAGELDAVISPRPPSCFTDGTAPVARLFPDFRAAELAYNAATGFFPIMHCVAIRRRVAEENPWLPLALFEAFCRAKSLSIAELAMVNVMRISLPFIAAELAATRAAMGANYWPYGLLQNEKELRAMTRYATADGLAVNPIDPEALFHPTTHGAVDPG